MRSVLLAAALVLSSAQTQPPDTEVFLADLKVVDGRISVSAPRNISNSPGYDNQPSFTPDGTAVLFTSARGGTPTGGTAAQTDIYRYDIATQKLSQVTGTPESEYSATVTPDGQHISVIRVEADKAQRLWRFPLSGAGPSLVFTDIKPVGYHAWLDANTVAMFVLGEPATLQVGDVRTGKAEVVASDIGRSLQPVPGGGVSFIQRAGQGPQRTMTASLLTAGSKGRTTKVLTPLAPGATEEFVVWMPDGTLLMAAGGQLHAWTQGEKEWRAIADLSVVGLRNVSRLAVSPKGNWLALVAAR
jgi:dipeptidyl aminopeptidase/acylaminoacyl peptidase